MKMAAEVRWLALFIIFVALRVANGNTIHRKFEYKYSFKPPYLAQRDGNVPFWEYGGNAIASAENVRVAPSLRSQKGAIWTKKPIDFEWWEIDLVFHVTGRGRIGADGLAFWYTQSKGSFDGTVFGSSDKWNGLGIFFDSFDNDSKNNNPYIMAVVNDGTQIFDHTNDGGAQISAGCQRDFRNKPFPTRAKITYYHNKLRLFYDNGMTNQENYELCFEADNVTLPKGGFFGVSAATGGLADDHDVRHFLTTSLHDLDPTNVGGRQVSQEEENRITKEFEDYQSKVEVQKADYRRDHPEAKKENEFDDWFETDNQRELRQIYESHSQVFGIVQGMKSDLKQVVDKQERTLNLMTQLQVGGIQTTGGQPGQPMLIDTIRRQEVDAVLNNQNIILNTAHEVKAFIGELNSKADTIINQQLRAPTAQVQPIGYDYQSLISEMRDGINTLKREIAQTNAKLGGTGHPGQIGDCPNVNCLSTTMFLVFLAIQMAALLGYHMYKDNREAQAKKFF